MTAPIRVAVVGGAFATNAVAPAFERHPRFSVTAVTSSRHTAAVAEACARDDVDLVSVHAAPLQHRAVVDLALDAGRHVVCDKPFGAGLDDARHLAARAREHAHVTLTTFQFRHEPWRRVVRDLITDGALGSPVCVDWVEHHRSWRTPPRGWQRRRSTGGGWLGAMGSHILDTVTWWTGEATVVAADLGIDAADDVAEVAATVALRAEAGGSATVAARGASSLASGPRVVVAGSAAAVTYTPESGLMSHGVTTELPSTPTRRFPELLDAWCTGVASAIDGADTTEVATFQDGLSWARLRAGTLHAVTSTPSRRNDGAGSDHASANPG